MGSTPTAAAGGEGVFCDHCWDATAPLRGVIYDMPFVKELAEGVLERSRFQYYMEQDAAYLKEFARALSIAASKAQDSADQVSLATASANAVKVESSLHDGFLEQFGVTEEMRSTVMPSPTCSGYVSYLLATAHTMPVEVLCAALLPCFWLYMDVGQTIMGMNIPGNKYQAWIDMYAGEEFGADVILMKDLCNRLAASASSKVKAQMMQAFAVATRFEWMFWDAAYRMEQWPISLNGQTGST